MKSWLCNLEEELFAVINNSPLSIDIKYFVLKSVYLNMEKACKEYLSLPDEAINNNSQSEEKQIIDYSSEEDKERKNFKVEKTVDEEGNFHIEAQGADVGKVITEAFKQMPGDIADIEEE